MLKGRERLLTLIHVILTIVIGRDIVLSKIHITHITMYTRTTVRSNKTVRSNIAKEVSFLCQKTTHPY